MSFADLAPGTHADRMRDHWWWRPGWHVGQRAYTWHLTFAGQEDLHQLVRHHQETLSAVAGIDPVPQEWLHLTMQGVGFAGDVTSEKITRVLEATRPRLSHLPPLTLTFGAPVVADEAIVLPAEPEEAVKDLRSAIRDGLGAALGTAQVGEDPGHLRPHVSLAYSSAEHEAAPIVAMLEDRPAEPVTISVEAASLIVIHRDHKIRASPQSSSSPKPLRLGQVLLDVWMPRCFRNANRWGSGRIESISIGNTDQ